MTADVQALRTLLERLETEHPDHGSDPRYPGTAAVARQRREELIARVNAYSALVMHGVAHPADPHIHRYVPSDDPNYLECDGCHHLFKWERFPT